MLSKKILIFANLFLVFSMPVNAYLDPGTGSMITYFIVSIFMTSVFYIKDFYFRLTSMITTRKIGVTSADLTDVEILFYSEGAHYWNVFLPIIRSLEYENVKCAYYASDSNDNGLKYKSKNLVTKYIGYGVHSNAILNTLKVKIVVMTTPQIDVMYLKRSKHVKHYVHVVHSPIDALYYNKFAFDYFDTIMCSGFYQIDSIRQLEKLRGLDKKNLLKTGLTYYDIMVENKTLNSAREIRDKLTIMVAPTWGDKGMLTRFDIGPLKILLESGYNVIFRPHPQMYISQKEMIKNIELELLPYSNLLIDTSSSAVDAMSKSDILISDISGIIFDFFFVYERPVITIEGKLDKRGFEAEDIQKEAWEVEILSKVSTIVSYKDINKLKEKIEGSINKKVKEKAMELRSEAVYNFSRSGSVAADQLINLTRGISYD
jgi:hypothetical protein